MKFQAISRKIDKSIELHEILNFEAIHPSESLIFLRKYWCFCDLLIFTKMLIFAKKVKISKGIIFCFFGFYGKVNFCRKWAQGGPKTPKVYKKHLFYKGWRIRAARVRKLEKLRKLQRSFCVSDGKFGILHKKLDFHEISSFCTFPNPCANQ